MPTAGAPTRAPASLGCNPPPRNPKTRSAAGERARQLADRLLVLLVLDLGEVAGDFEQHPLMRRRRPLLLLTEPVVEICDRRIEDAGDLVKPASRDAIDAAFGFVCLLIGNADHFGE